MASHVPTIASKRIAAIVATHSLITFRANLLFLAANCPNIPTSANPVAALFTIARFAIHPG